MEKMETLCVVCSFPDPECYWETVISARSSLGSWRTSRKIQICADLFREGVDFHSFTAERLKISRDKARKCLTSPWVIELPINRYRKQLKCCEREAQNEIDKWWALFPQLRRWQESLIYDSKRSGFCTTILGRRIKIDDLQHGKSWRREGAERQLINNITQGSAAEVMKLAMIKAVQHIPYLGLLIQVYDQLVFEAETDRMLQIM